MAYNYSNKDYNKEHMAKAVGRALPISTKASIEICNTIRGKTVARAKTILKDVVAMKKPIKYTRFTAGAGHKKGMAAGKYPQNAAGEILDLIEAVEANAQFKGLNTSELTIKHICAQNAGNVWRYGRHRRRKMKRTNIEIIIEESKSNKKEKTDTKTKDEGKKAEIKKENKTKESKSKEAEDKK